MRIALDPPSIHATARSLIGCAAQMSLISTRLRGGYMPEMPGGMSAAAQAAVEEAAATLRSVALVYVDQARELELRVAMLECGGVGPLGLLSMWNLLQAGGSSAVDSSGGPFERAFLEEQSISWISWLSEKGAQRLLARVEGVNEMLATAGANYDEAIELFDQGRYWEILSRTPEGRVPVDEFAHLFSQSKKLGILRTGAKGVAVVGSVAGAALAYDHSVARTRVGKTLSGAASIAFTKTGPLIAYDTVTGGAGTASADLFAVAVEGLGDGEIELDDYVAWSEANSNGDNGWVLQRYSQLGDVIGGSDELSMYEVDDDGNVRLGPPWRWFD